MSRFSYGDQQNEQLDQQVEIRENYSSGDTSEGMSAYKLSNALTGHKPSVDRNMSAVSQQKLNEEMNVLNNMLNQARNKRLDSQDLKNKNLDLYEPPSGGHFITQDPKEKPFFYFFENWQERSKYLLQLLDQQLQRLEIVKTLEMSDLRPTKDKSLANYAKHINKLLQTLIQEDLKSTEDTTGEKISYGWLLNDENEIRKELREELRQKKSKIPSAMYDQSLESEVGEERGYTIDGLDQDATFEEKVESRLKMRKVEQMEEFNYVLGAARRQELEEWVKLCLKNGLISTKEKDEKIEFLNDNWQEGLTKGKNSYSTTIEQKIGFFQTEPVKDKEEIAKNQQKQAKQMVNRLRNDQKIREQNRKFQHSKDMLKQEQEDKIKLLTIEANEMAKKEEQQRKRAFIQARINERKQKSSPGNLLQPSNNLTLSKLSTPMKLLAPSTFDSFEVIVDKRQLMTPSILISMDSATTALGKADRHIAESKPYNTVVPKKPQPLFKQLQSRYDRREEVLTLAMKKKRLEEIRSLKKPINLTQIQEHSKNYLEQKQKVEDEIQRKRQIEQQLAKSAKAVLPEMTPEKKEKFDFQSQKRKQLNAIREEINYKKKAMRDFGDHARVKYKPKESSRLVNELKNRKESLIKKKLSISIDKPSNQQIDYMKDWRNNKSIVAKAREELDLDSVGETRTPQHGIQSARAYPKKMNPANSYMYAHKSPSIQSTGIDLRYPVESNSAGDSLQAIKANKKQIQSYLKDPSMNDKQKVEQMKAHAALVAQRAREEEYKLQVQQRQRRDLENAQPFTLRAVEREIAVNDIYIESINAKLQLLNNH